MICRNCGSEIGQGETFCRHCAYSCKHDSSTISVKVSVSGNSSARAIRNLALRASKLANASGLLITGRLAHNLYYVLIHASMIRT